MEYEIDDDPQGLPEQVEADRDGGSPDKLLFGQKRHPDHAIDSKDMAIEQPGEMG